MTVAGDVIVPLTSAGSHRLMRKPCMVVIARIASSDCAVSGNESSLARMMRDWSNVPTDEISSTIVCDVWVTSSPRHTGWLTR
ncbi:hypothetical protein D3C87_1446060 [compost metagenome]